MPEYLLKVFVSATSRDLGSFREVVGLALLRGGAHPCAQESFPPDYRTIREILRDSIASCDAVICLVGFCYGAAPPQPWEHVPRSYTQTECDVARELGKPVYVFLASDECPLDGPPAEGAMESDLQRRHRQSLMQSEHKYHFFSSREELQLKIAELIPELVVKFGRPAVLSPDLAHAPEAPAFFSGRVLELGQLEEALERPEPCVITIVGPGGQGKSTLAWKWWRDHQPTSFTAVFWRTAYRGGYSFDQFLDDVLIYLLGDKFDKGSHRETSARVTRLLLALRQRKSLVVIDGIERWLRGWYQCAGDSGAGTQAVNRQGLAGLDDFLAGATTISNGTHVLLTTRALPAVLDDAQHATVPVYDERRVELAGLDNEAAVELMRKLQVKGDSTELLRVAQGYANHPLALRVLGRLLTKKFAGRLERLDRVTALDPEDRLFQLLNETRANLPGRERSERFLAVASHCLEDASLPTLAAGLGLGDEPSPGQIDSLLGQAVELADWHVIGWNAEAEVVALHPLIKEYFSLLASDSAAIHRRLSEWYARQPIALDASAMNHVGSRFLAIEHALRAGELGMCSFLMFAPMTARFSFVEWLSAWGHLETGADLLGRLAEASGPARRAEFLIARGALYRQLGRLPRALQSLDRAVAILEEANGHAGPDRLASLAGALMNRGNVQREALRYDEALADYNRAVHFFEELAHGDPTCQPHLASAHMNRGNTLRDKGLLSEALSDCSRAIELHEALLESTPQAAESALASARMNRGNVFADKRQYADALVDFDCAVAIYDRLLATGYEELNAGRARAQVMRGATLIEYNRSGDALPILDEAIRTVGTLVDTGRKELEALLALAWMDRGLACIRLERWLEAIDACDRAVATFGSLIAGDRGEQEGWLAHSLLNRSEARYATADIEGSAQDRSQGLEIIRRVLRRGQTDVLIMFVRKVVTAVDYLSADAPGESAALINEVLAIAEQTLRGTDATEALRSEVQHALNQWIPLLPMLRAAGLDSSRILCLQGLVA